MLHVNLNIIQFRIRKEIHNLKVQSGIIVISNF